MNYKLLFLLVLVFSLFFFYLEKDVVAPAELVERIKVKIVIVEVDLTVRTDKELPDGYCPPEQVNITNKLDNVGDLNVTGDLTVKIFDPDGTEVYTNTWTDIEILVGETQYYNAYYTVQETDKASAYIVGSNFSYDGKFSYSERNFKVKIGIGTLIASPRRIEETIAPDKYKNKTLALWLVDACEDTTAILSKSTGDVGDWVTFSDDRVFLPATGDLNTSIATITVPSDTPEGTYYGTIFVDADGQRIPINLIINVSLIDFFVNVTVPPERKEVCPGEGVYAGVNITKYYPNETVNITIFYQILDSLGIVLDEENETLEINETPLLINTPILIVPASATPNFYTFLVTVKYNLSFVQDSDIFEVISCIPPPPPPTPPGPGPGPTPGPPAPPPVQAITLKLSTDLLTVFLGNRTSFIAYVENIGTGIVKSIKITVEGIPSDWINIFPLTSDINPGSVEEYLIIINVPKDAEIGFYDLEVQAVDGVESEIRTLKLIVGRNPKEIADLLLIELDRIRADANESLAIEECIDITVIKTIHHDAELAREKGLEEYKKENYARAINWFEHAIPVHKKVVYEVDITLEIEIETSNVSRIVIPPMFNAEEQFLLAGSYLDEKNYQEICDPIVKIRNFIMIGLIFWPAIIIFFVILFIFFIIFYRRSRRREREKTLERVRKRLGKPLEE